MVGSMHRFVKGLVPLPHTEPFIDCPKPCVIACEITLLGIESAFCITGLYLKTQPSGTQNSNTCGAVAQLGARVNGIHEVAGSIPASSTTPSFARAGRYFEYYRN